MLTVAGITTIIAVIVTLLLQYVPGLRVSWAGLQSNVKGLTILGLYLVVGAVVAFGGCIPALLKVIPSLMCVEAGAFLNYALGVALAIASGQGIYGLLPELEEVTITKDAR